MIDKRKLTVLQRRHTIFDLKKPMHYCVCKTLSVVGANSAVLQLETLTEFTPRQSEI